MTPANYLFHLSRRTLKYGFDSTIAQVAYPAIEPQQLRHIPRGGPIANALNATGNQHMGPNVA
jgi:hypothetical protein